MLKNRYLLAQEKSIYAAAGNEATPSYFHPAATSCAAAAAAKKLLSLTFESITV